MMQRYNIFCTREHGSKQKTSFRVLLLPHRRKRWLDKLAGLGLCYLARGSKEPSRARVVILFSKFASFVGSTIPEVPGFSTNESNLEGNSLKDFFFFQAYIR